MTSSEELIGQIAEPVECELSCIKHGKYIGKVHTIFSKTFETGCKGCEDEQKQKEAEDDAAREAKRKDDMIRNSIKRSAIPSRFIAKTFDNYISDNKDNAQALNISKQYAKMFRSRLETGGGLIFCGKPGTGKTHLSCAIANHVMRELRLSVLFTSVLKLTRQVKETYSRDSNKTEREAIDLFSVPSLLIIDEVGVQYGSDAEKQILFEVVNNRYEEMLPTILISNLTLKELKDFIGDRVIDRMREGGGALVSFDWNSHRGRD